MASVKLTITVGQIDKPAGITGGLYHYIMHPVPVGSDIEANNSAVEHTFNDVPAGEYIAYCQRRAVEGGYVGNRFSAPVTVTESVPGAEQIDVVVGLSAVVV